MAGRGDQLGIERRQEPHESRLVDVGHELHALACQRASRGGLLLVEHLAEIGHRIPRGLADDLAVLGRQPVPHPLGEHHDGGRRGMLGQAVDLGDLVVAGPEIGDDVVLRRVDRAPCQPGANLAVGNGNRDGAERLHDLRHHR